MAVDKEEVALTCGCKSMTEIEVAITLEARETVKQNGHQKQPESPTRTKDQPTPGGRDLAFFYLQSPSVQLALSDTGVPFGGSRRGADGRFWSGVLG